MTSRVAQWKGVVPELRDKECRKSQAMHQHKGETPFGSQSLGLTEDVVKSLPQPRTVSIRSTPMSTLELCPRKFLLVDRMGIQAAEYQSALELGGYYHQVLQGIYLGYTDEEALKIPTRVYNREVQKTVDLANEGGYLPNGTLVQKVLEQMHTDYHKAMAMALAFVKFKPFDWDEYEILKSPEGQPMVEAVLKCTIPGVTAAIVAPCDLAVRKKGTNEVWIVDHKTCSRSPKMRAEMSLISHQMKLYRLVLQTHLNMWADEGGEKLVVVGGLLTAIQKPTIKYCPDGTDRDGFQHYADRLKGWYEDYAEAHPDNPPIVKFQHRFTEPVLTREFLVRLRQQAKASMCSVDLDSFYRTGYPACNDFQKVCHCFGLCTSNPRTWAAQLANPKFQIKFREDDE